ncbi:methionyl-tRNA formyltransferase [Psychrobacillus sp. INOP01]|uniref:methionyl-tRNA formyltransferase n=1 Tax=Psychrobacillus sp. INOP01 TaxID=2829187 RepID=UPI001BA4D39D|nr:methionyl-tRNA formyltransferase [Psychrobacillus sp. INOP01]QUG41041.1 methionyl-tRNA formyltransferase [Psychrobacillus sp. INOP01]
MTSIIFMGTPTFSAPILRMLVDEGYKVKAVVTQPDRPVGRKKVLTAPPVKEEAIQLGLPVIQPNKLKGSDELDQIIALKPDLIVTAAFGQILPKELLEVPELGCINVHASLLPAYRGGAPIHQAIIDGQSKTGVTIMYMEEKLDAGDIISQSEISIEHSDDTGLLFEKLSAVGSELLKETLPSIIAKTNNRTKQDDTKVTFAKNISREQERIDWNNSALQLHNQIRGLHPWPVAYTTLDGQVVKIWKADTTSIQTNEKPGTVVKIESEYFVVQTGKSEAIRINELQPAGKKKLSAEDYLRGVGSKLRIGDIFE